tara:strand:+ start:735348 stop:735698 length:351 start_codon:yes stop_codon:yes gene_type:complete
MNNNINTLADLRTAAGIQLQDLAYLIGIDHGHLQKIEIGDRDPSVTVILLYHMLFKARLEDMFADLYANLHAQLFERSETLIAKLERKQSPKSIHRLESITKIVNSLDQDHYELVN